MKTTIIAAVTAVALAGTGIAAAQTVNADANVKAGSATASTNAGTTGAGVKAEADVKADADNKAGTTGAGANLGGGVDAKGNSKVPGKPTDTIKDSTNTTK